MHRTPKNILQHELIGLIAEVRAADNAANIGICGEIVDERQKVIRISTNKGIKTIPKAGTVFAITLPDKTKVIIKGDRLLRRPEERIKIKSYKW